MDLISGARLVVHVVDSLLIVNRQIVTSMNKSLYPLLQE